MRATVLLFVPALATLTACGDLPRDPEGTIERIRATHTIRLGDIDGVPTSPAAEQTLARAAGRLGARIERVSGHGEALLDKLENGELDAVYGHFAENSPWSTNVHFGTPQGPREDVDKETLVPRFAFRNGENGWISLVEEAGQ